MLSIQSLALSFLSPSILYAVIAAKGEKMEKFTVRDMAQIALVAAI